MSNSNLPKELAAKRSYYLNKFAEVLIEPDLDIAEAQHEAIMAEIRADMANYTDAIDAEIESLNEQPEMQAMLRQWFDENLGGDRQ